jgi:probable phosphoglycerate mutase
MICYLIRHGKDDDSVRGGWSNSGLTAEGKSQVKNLVDFINENKNKLKIEKLFSSDLLRAVETIMPISTILNLKFEFKPEFRETNNGVLAGMPNNIVNENYPGLF